MGFVPGVHTQKDQLIGTEVAGNGAINAEKEGTQTRILMEKALVDKLLQLVHYVRVIGMNAGPMQLADDVTERGGGHQGVQLRVGVINHMVDIVIQIHFQNGIVYIMQQGLVLELRNLKSVKGMIFPYGTRQGKGDAVGFWGESVCILYAQIHKAGAHVFETSQQFG